MTKQSGVGVERLVISGVDVSGNIGAVDTIRVGANLVDHTDITQYAVDRRKLLSDGEVTFKAWWDGTPSTGVNEVFKALPSAASVAFTHGFAVASPAACVVGAQTNYDITRSPEGTLAATINVQSTTGAPLEWGFTLTTAASTPWQTFASAGNGSDVDDLGGSPTSTAFGGILYVHCLSLGSGSFTAKVQDAATLPTYSDVSGLVTGTINAVGATRVVTTTTTTTIRRYTRVVLSGTFSNAAVLAVLVRPMAAQA